MGSKYSFECRMAQLHSGGGASLAKYCRVRAGSRRGLWGRRLVGPERSEVRVHRFVGLSGGRVIVRDPPFFRLGCIQRSLIKGGL